MHGLKKSIKETSYNPKKLECYSNLHYKFISESKIRVDRNLTNFPGLRHINELPRNFLESSDDEEEEEKEMVEM